MKFFKIVFALRKVTFQLEYTLRIKMQQLIPKITAIRLQRGRISKEECLISKNFM